MKNKNFTVKCSALQNKPNYSAGASFTDVVSRDIIMTQYSDPKKKNPVRPEETEN